MSGLPENAKVPMFGAKKLARSLQAELATMREQLDRLGAMSIAEREHHKISLEAEISQHEQTLTRQREQAAAEAAQHQGKLDELRKGIVVTEDIALLQEAGVYEYRHPLDDAVAYQTELGRIKDEIKAMNRKDGGSILASTDWTVNGSAAQGRKMIRDYSKLMLRAFNAEADTLVRGLKPYKLERAIERMGKVAEAIEKLGKTMNMQVAPAYHRIRVQELELTADFLEKQAEEKEREREERARLREEQKAQKEMEKERAKLEKEKQHHENAIQKLIEQGDEEAVARLREELTEIEKAMDDVDYRAANIRAGYVYVISNVGASGEQMIKVGMTRRLDPQDRVRELSDASVPFNYDIHALHFSKDAVGIESAMHERLADRRVNRVNLRREFFYATPAETKAHLAELAGDLLQFDEVPEALEYRQSQHVDATSSEPVAVG